MKRRTFCAAAVAALAAAAYPYRRAGAAAASEVGAIGLDAHQLTLKAADLDDLRAGLRGELITAEQPGYDSARRLWNPAFDRHPALIVRCLGAADVRRAVSFATAHGLLTAVRAGGHSFSGQSGCDGGLVIDVSPMRAVEIDPNFALAWAEMGVAQASELASVPGIKVVGPLPGDLNSEIVFAVGVGSTSADPVAAKSLIEFLTGPVGAAILKSKGMDPA